MFVVSLFDPFLVDCIVFYQYSSADSTGKLHDIHGIKGHLWWLFVRRLKCKENSGGCNSYNQSVFDTVFNVFGGFLTVFNECRVCHDKWRD